MDNESGNRGVEPPSKRRRLSADPFDALNNDSTMMDAVASRSTVSVPEPLVSSKESELGIQDYIGPLVAPVTGKLKTRYSDFIVNEILPSGRVVHLHNTRAPTKKQKSSDRQSERTAPTQAHETIDDVVHEPSVNNGQTPTPLNTKAPQVSDDDEGEVSEEQFRQLAELLNETAATGVRDLYQSIRINMLNNTNTHPTVRTEFTADRSLRSKIHQFIRETFHSSIESSTDNNGVLVLTAARSNNRGKQQWKPRNKSNNSNNRTGKLGWIDRGGEYVHFTLYKENKDTMEAISWLTKQLRCNAKNFQFAGTKDRRAVTTQRCSAYRIEAERLAAQNQTLRGSKIGDFEYRHQGLELGDLGGNQFSITLRDYQNLDSKSEQLSLTEIHEDMQRRLSSLRENGFLNYYGEQRFGTFTVRTDVIGRHILKEDYGAACNSILSFESDALDAARNQDSASTIGQDDRNRAMALHKWHNGQNSGEALEILPRKFSAEAQLVRHLAKNPNDFLGALMTVQRNLRLMYVHAYQSLVWNMAATNRMKLYSSKVTAGDLVLVNEHKDKDLPISNSIKQDEQQPSIVMLDEDGEPIIQPQPNDSAAQGDDIFERARPLTESEAASGLYTIFDIVLPQPGYDILYPNNASGEFYKTFMSSKEGGGLDPYNMRRKHREFSLSGSYRKVVARIGSEFDIEVHRYERDEKQFVKTDLDLMKERENLEKQAKKGNDEADEVDRKSPRPREDVGDGAPDNEGQASKIAVVLKFQLGPSQYATMALRELSRGGIAHYKPDFSGGR